MTLTNIPYESRADLTPGLYNIAEIELRVITGQCLNRRIPDKQVLEREVAQWQNQRNFLQAKVDWRFSTDDARIKLKRLYPTLST